METASKRAVSPSSMLSEAKSVLEEIPQEVLNDAIANQDNFGKVLDSESGNCTYCLFEEQPLRTTYCERHFNLVCLWKLNDCVFECNS